MTTRNIFLLAIAFLFLKSADAAGQTSLNAATEVWPSVKATFEWRAKTRLQLSGETQHGVDFPYRQWKLEATLSHRMKEILKPHQPDIDEENEHYLTFGVGYEYAHTTENDKIKRENRILLDATPRYIPGAGLLLTDRNRVEFRWVNGEFDVRYRNRLTIQRGFKLNKFHFTPYASGELFYDRNHHSWNENQYAFGVQLPYKRRLRFDTYYLRQNCTTCNPAHANVLGLTLNLYFRKKK